MEIGSVIAMSKSRQVGSAGKSSTSVSHRSNLLQVSVLALNIDSNYKKKLCVNIFRKLFCERYFFVSKVIHIDIEQE